MCVCVVNLQGCMGKSVLLTFIPMYVHQILLNFHRDRQDQHR